MMKLVTSVFLALLMAACGMPADRDYDDFDNRNQDGKKNDGSCSAHAECDASEVCIANRCREAAGRKYDFTFVSATVPTQTSSKEAWDAFGGAPDPFAVLLVDDVEVCRTAVALDTFTPSWNKKCSATLYNSSTFTVHIYDEDVSAHDYIDGFKSDDALLAARWGGISGTPYTGSRISITLTIAPK